MAATEKLTGIRRDENRVREYLERIGMIPSKADPDEREQFVKEEPNPRLKEAEEGGRVVFVVDAAHFVPGFLWIFTGIFIGAPAGRKRFNVPGELNAVTHEMTTSCNKRHINTERVYGLLREISEAHLETPVTSALDKGRYRNCGIARRTAETINIELLYILPCSPNLNLIERRLRKFVKKKSKYYLSSSILKQR